jgi:hypothetical protein
VRSQKPDHLPLRGVEFLVGGLAAASVIAGNYPLRAPSDR